jgi:hypothetical protein
MTALYDTDFLRWTEEQGALLRATRPARLDWERLAEEVEDLGVSVLTKIDLLVVQILVHLLRIEHAPAVALRPKWQREITAFRLAVGRHLKRAPSAIDRLDLDDLFDTARLLTDVDAEDENWPVRPMACPYTLDRILDLECWPASLHGHSS